MLINPNPTIHIYAPACHLPIETKKEKKDSKKEVNINHVKQT
jgi:hypothetical protein